MLEGLSPWDVEEVVRGWVIYSGDDFDETSRDCEVFVAGWVAGASAQF